MMKRIPPDDMLGIVRRELAPKLDEFRRRRFDNCENVLLIDPKGLEDLRQDCAASQRTAVVEPPCLRDAILDDTLITSPDEIRPTLTGRPPRPITIGKPHEIMSVSDEALKYGRVMPDDGWGVSIGTSPADPSEKPR